MKHKVGDKIRIKSIDWYNRERSVNGYINGKNSLFGFIPEMKVFCGKEAIIISTGTPEKAFYTLKFNNEIEYHMWEDYMLEDEK